MNTELAIQLREDMQKEEKEPGRKREKELSRPKGP